MQHTGPSRLFRDSFNASGLHLLDVSMFWGHIGGVRRVISAKHALLGNLGWRHTVMAPNARGPGHVDCGGIPLPATGGYRVVIGRGRAERLIEEIQPDIIEAADPYSLAWAVLDAGARLKVPRVAFCHSDLPAMAARLIAGPSALTTRRGRWAARSARDYLVDLYSRFDRVLAPSRSMAERLRNWGLARVVVQPLGVDCTVFRPEARDPAWRDALCARLNLKPETRLLLYSGRFATEKNLPLLVDAVRLLGAGHALLAVGAGPLPPRGPGVHVLPMQHDSRELARIVASVDAYVHAGDQETFGLGVLEAMACATPIVVSAAGGLGELAREAGITVLRQRGHEWAEAIHASLTAAPAALTDTALRRAREHDWPWIIDQLTCRYLTLIRRQHAVPTRTGLAGTLASPPLAPIP